MASNKLEDQKVDVNFESHPPIEGDLNGIAALLKQTLLQYVDCQSLAKHVIAQKDLTQVIAQEVTDEDSTSEDDEPDDDIYGVSSIIELTEQNDDNSSVKQILAFIKDKFPEFKKMTDEAKDKIKIGLIINERYINLPPQLSLPIFETLTKSIDTQSYTHLIFIFKILMRSKNTDTRLPNKKSKSGNASSHNTEPIVYVNPEEEVIFEQSDFHTDLDVSAHCDENASWSSSSDVKYIPHRRIVVMNYKNWPKTLECLAKELN